MRLENYHKQGKLYECVYVCNTHVVTFLGAMTLLVGHQSSFWYVCVVSQKAIKLSQGDESSGKGPLMLGL